VVKSVLQNVELNIVGFGAGVHVKPFLLYLLFFACKNSQKNYMLNISKSKLPIGEKLKDELYVFELLHTPRFARILAYWIGAILLLCFAALFLPWQQNISGYGRLTAFRPEDRPQKVYPVVGGRIEEWHIQEGQYVRKGDILAVISEIKDYYFDPKIKERMESQIEAQRKAIEALQNKVKALDDQIFFYNEAMQLEVSQAENKVKQLLYKISIDSADLIAAETMYKNAQLQYQREKELFAKALTSRTELENKELKARETEAKLNSAQNKLETSRNEYRNTLLDVQNKRATYSSYIAKAQSEKSSSLAYLNENVQKLIKQENELANVEVRQGNYVIRAPQNGYVVKSLKAGIGEIVKEGEALVTIMPDKPELAVELYVSPNDVPLLKKGTKVRLQFEGWPALVFSGWENVSIGTFGGEIAVIDYINTKNTYRILVVPDVQDESWPAALRVGSNVYGWAMLNEVPVWYELWRQLNAFPPLPIEGSDYDKSESEKEEEKVLDELKENASKKR
jgi:multidrug resistance efflux pump